VSVSIRKINQITINAVPGKFLTLSVKYIFIYIRGLVVSDILDALITDRINVSGYERSFCNYCYMQEYLIVQVISDFQKQNVSINIDLFLKAKQQRCV
jgi:hypothetical protein